MTGVEALARKFMLPPVSQIGVVVRDVDRTAEFYSSNFGIGPFTIYEFSPDHYWHHEKPAHMRQKQGKAMLGSIELELVQPLEGESIYLEFLETEGEGLNHLGFNVAEADYDVICAGIKEAGFQTVLRVESFSKKYNGWLRACCFDTRRVGGVMFEILYKSWLAKP
jgi:hypothetical protein